MGLDTSHNCWHGPYSAFTRWRNAIAEAAGYKVERIADSDGMVWPTVVIDWAALERDNPGCYQGDWNTMPDDALLYLIAHSDCDGVIQPDHARTLAQRLQEILPQLTNGPLDAWHAKTQQFITGLYDAASRGEVVEFH